jgi:hypothetical protein
MANEDQESSTDMKIEGVRKRFIRSNPTTPMNVTSQPLNIAVSAAVQNKQPHDTIKFLIEDLKFHATIDFVRAYLDNVVQQNSPFGDKEQNKLTFEVNLFKKSTHA